MIMNYLASICGCILLVLVGVSLADSRLDVDAQVACLQEVVDRFETHTTKDQLRLCFPSTLGLETFVDFIITTGSNLELVTANSATVWGQWMIGRTIVKHVNNLRVTSTDSASFRGSGRSGSAVGVQGSFELHDILGHTIATVEFSTQHGIKNTFEVKVMDPSYVCDHTPFPPFGSFTANIQCSKPKL